MKKMLSAIIAGVMVFSQGIPGFAKDTEELTKVLSGIKSRIPDTESYKDFNANTYDENGEKRYSFEWENNVDEKYSSLRITVSPGGVITNYNYYDETIYERGDNSPTMNKLSSDEALAKAKELIKALNPDIYPSLRIEKYNRTESLYDNNYSFGVVRTENGVPVYDNEGSVTVNKDASKLINFYINYSENLEFPEIEAAMNVDGAWDSFGKNAGMELEYGTEYNDGKVSAVLIYSPKMKSDQFIDAFTGKVEDIAVRNYGYKENGASANMKAEVMESAEGDSGLTEREIQELDTVSGLLSEEEAQKLVRDNSALDFDSDMKLNNIYCYKSTNGNTDEYYYRMYFSNNKDDDFRYAWAQINAKTGELMSWNSGYQPASDEKELSDDELKNAADELLLKVAPKHFGENSAKDYKPDDKIDNTFNYLVYTRYVNGIKFSNDKVTIGINPTTKKLTNYRLDYSEMDFPSPDGVISEAEAVEKLKEQTELNMYYIPTISDPENKEIKTPDTVRIGYMLKDVYGCRLDAKTGKLLDDDYSENNPPVYTDISGHYAEKAINELAKFGIGFESGELKPDSIITQEEYAALLVSAFVDNSPIILRASSLDTARNYKRAVNKKIIRADDGEASSPLTREKAAIFMVRAMGGEKYAQIPGIFNSLFPDVKNNVGYISILAGLKVFNGDENGNFNPDKMLTRAEAMTAIYNYLTR